MSSSTFVSSPEEAISQSKGKYLPEESPEYHQSYTVIACCFKA
jgi:hypothetical protein